MPFYSHYEMELSPKFPKITRLCARCHDYRSQDMEQLADYVRDTMSSPSASMARVHAREMVQERLLTETTEKVVARRVAIAASGVEEV